MAALILTDSQKVTLGIAPKTAAGNPAKVDGAPVWSTSDETVLTLTPSDDGLSVVVLTTGKLGDAQVSVLADADLGEGVTQLSGVLDVSVLAGPAVSLDISAAAPESRL